MSEKIQVEVCYALRERQELLSVSLPAGATVAAAIEASGICAKFPEIDVATSKIGVFGKLVKLDAALHDRDRVEIYRPLIADPKEVRRKRAEDGKAMKKGGGDLAAAE